MFQEVQAGKGGEERGEGGDTEREEREGGGEKEREEVKQSVKVRKVFCAGCFPPSDS